MSPLNRLSLDIKPPVARIALSNPPLNIIDLAMMDEISSAFAGIEAKPEVSIVILEGDGKCFSAGVDVVAHAPERVAVMLEKFHRVIRVLVSTRKVTIAKVHGHCLGGGAELAMVCDVAYTTVDAEWGFPEIQLGCFPPVAATALSALIGQKCASELILSGRIVSGAEAADIGLATRALATDQLDHEVGRSVTALSKLSPAALAICKRAMYTWDSLHFDKGLARAEKIYLDELVKTADAAEGIQAFTEKRAPKWRGM